MKIICLKIHILLCVLILLQRKTIYSQISSENIELYSKTYNDNKVNKSIDISPNGQAYAYILESTNTCIVTLDETKSISIPADNLIFLSDKELFYEKENRLYKRNLYDIDKNILLNTSQIKDITVTDNMFLITFNSNELFIYKENDITIFNFTSQKYYYDLDNKKLQFFFNNQSSILYYNNTIKKIEDSIINIVAGIEETLLLGQEYNYIYNNSKNTISKKLKNNNTNLLLFTKKSNLRFYQNYIYSDSVIKNTSPEDVFMTTDTLNIHLFLDISNYSALSERNKTQTYRINIETGNIELIDTYIPTLSYNEATKKFHKIITYYTSEKETVHLKTIISNLTNKKTLFLDSLYLNYSSYYVTPDGKYVFISTEDDKLYRYNFLNNKLLLISKEFPYRNNSYEYIEKINNILVSSYNIETGSVIINTRTVPYIISEKGLIDSLDIPDLKSSNYSINHVLTLNKNDQIIYKYNIETGVSTLFYYSNRKILKLTENENLKSAQQYLFNNGITGYDGFIKKKGNQIYWSESNLKNGHTYFKYDISQNKITELNIKSNLKHDSLDYKYISIKHENKIITGCFKFPKNYKENKKYPVIIQIYLNKTQYLHLTGSYINPYKNIQNKAYSAILNDLNLLHQDYIICYIDIPIINHLYSSNSEDINIFIKKVFPKIQAIDMEKIAITGHSRSAGQVLGALVEDNSIKCAIISNGITSELIDLTTFSNISIKYQKTNIDVIKYSRFSRRYYNIGTSYNPYSFLQNNFEGIIKKDPFFKLDKIKSTILFIFNDNDGSINSSNGYFTYIKTKLLNKNTYLINFLKEGHVILNEENASILYNHVIKYLNFYLKEEKDKNEVWNYYEK